LEVMQAKAFEMLIHVVNPNTTKSFTNKIDAAAQAAASPGTKILATQPDMGPVSIEGYYDEVFAMPGMVMRIIEAEKKKVSGHIIACFDDTGLDAARMVALAPVVGIGEAAFHAASLIAYKFSVVTTLSRSIPVIEHNLLRYGLASRCAKVRAAEVSVLSLEDANSPARARISREIEIAKSQDGCDAVVLGCAGMADLAMSLSQEHELPVIDGVSVAVGFVEMLARNKLRTSKLGGYAPPLAKNYTGLFASFAPHNN
jgi:allantoin racemase